ncbi:MAG: clostripain-related cysteine peptidase [Elusimicrobia bacterium]|nr:clostripain-related cysteine peptidase [Elusimicrobiota bacterium]
MNKTFKLLSVALSSLFLGASALKAQDNFELNGISAGDIRAMETGKGIFDFIKPGKPDGKPEALKEWTVMVFMNSKNDLSQSQLLGLSGKWAEKDLNEMKKVGTTDKVNVVVEYGTTGKGSKRMLVGKSGLFSSGETIYNQYPAADMGDYKRVIEFAKWAKTTFPARHYMFILWNHGLGWIDPVMKDHPAGKGASRGILFDDETKNYVRTRQLGEILRQTGYVDVFAMNACLMQMAEIDYEVKDNVGLIVASEETMLAYGFDYQKLLNFINANTAATNEQISDFFINWEKDFYANGASLIGPVNIPLSSITGTISTVRPQALNDLPPYLNALAGAAMRNNETEAVKTAIDKAVRFSSLDPKNDKKKTIAPYVDLYDFALLLGQNSKTQETRQAAENLMTFIKSKLVMRSIGLNSDAENGYDYTRVGGVAINMTMKIKTVPPQLDAVFETKYGELALSKASDWDEFVAWTDGVWRK